MFNTRLFSHKKRVVIVGFPLTLALMLPKGAFAANLGLSISPQNIRIHEVSPGDFTETLRIQNTSDQDVNLEPQLKPFTAADDESGTPNYQVDPKVTSSYQPLFQSIKLNIDQQSVSSIYLAAHEKKTVSLTLTPNKTDAYYSFSLLFISKESSTSYAKTTSQIRLGTGLNILLSVGKENPKAVIEEFSTRPFQEHGPVGFTLRVRNTSTHAITPQGTIIIHNMFSQAVGSLDLNKTTILPQTTRFLTNQIGGNQALWNENFLLGWYTARVNLVVSANGPIYSQDVRIFCVPLVPFGIIVLVAGAILFLKRKMRSYR